MLKEEIDDAKRSVSTGTVQITIGEIGTMYSSKELNILPEFQRLFRWTPEKKSTFIESIMIGIPVPPVFAFEKSDGTWELIDGLQRISTLLEFMGVLEDPDTGERRKSRLQATKYLPSLQNVVWEIDEQPVNDAVFELPDETIPDGLDELPAANTEDTTVNNAGMANNIADVETDIDNTSHGLDKSLQLFFRRSRIDFQILKYPSDEKTKFDLFQRLNRGGAYANEQEVRTCAMVLANSTFTADVRTWAAQEDFQKIFKVSADQRKAQKDVEYAVRCLVHTYYDFKRGKDVQEFLDDSIVQIMTNKTAQQALSPVQWAVATLYENLGANALIPDHPGIAKRFSLRALEGVVVGLARNRDAIVAGGNAGDFVKNKVENFWKQPEIQSMASPGLRGTVRLQRTVAFGTNWFKPND